MIEELISAKVNSTNYKPPTTKPPKWFYPTKTQIQYTTYLKFLMRQVSVPTIQYLKDNLPLWVGSINRKDSYSDDNGEFQDLMAEKQAEAFDDDTKKEIMLYAGAISLYNNSQWAKQVNYVMKDKVVFASMLKPEPYLGEVLKVWGDNNFTLIKSLSDEYIKKVNILVSDGLLNAKKSTDIIAEISVMTKQMTKGRAELIAVDQVGKLNGLLTKRRQQDAGVDYYEWVTAGDERVRDSHAEMDGTACDWDDSSVYSLNGGKTWVARPSAMQGSVPGSDIRCRCTSVPYWALVMEDI